VTQHDWSERFVGVIAEQVRHYRNERKMSAQQLANRCAELGLPVKRSVLANLESGRRTTVSVPELVVLARALGTAPILLMFPVGQQQTIELLPGTVVPVLDALNWFAAQPAVGSWPGTGGSREDWSMTSRGIGTVGLFRRHASELERRDVVNRDHADEELRVLRELMRERGLIPPELPPDLEYLDEPAHGGPREPLTAEDGSDQ
jgi:transcriptional regulator with XRE-family HTH domain